MCKLEEMANVRSWTRRYPWLVVTSAAAIGFAAGTFLGRRVAGRAVIADPTLQPASKSRIRSWLGTILRAATPAVQAAVHGIIARQLAARDRAPTSEATHEVPEHAVLQRTRAQ